MRVKLEILLDIPLCSCKDNALQWELRRQGGIRLVCEKCGTEMNVPKERFSTGFRVKDKPAPQPVQSNPEGKIGGLTE